MNMSSLGVKLSTIVFSICLVLGALTSMWLVQSEKSQLLVDEQQNLLRLSGQYAEQLNNLVASHSDIASSVNLVIRQSLSLSRDGTAPELNKGDDGALRWLNEQQGVFVPAYQDIDTHILEEFVATSSVWEQVAPIMLEPFTSFYFISTNSMVRISPNVWVNELPAEHDPRENVFYTIATPDNNPERKAVWTPVYFDDILNKWMTSLIVPLWLEQEFVGVTGADFVIDDFYQQIVGMNQAADGHQFFLFDKAGNVLVHPEISDVIAASQEPMNAFLDVNEHLDPSWQRLFEKIIAQPNPAQSLEFKHPDGVQLVSVTKIDNLQWYLGVYDSQHNLLAPLRELTLGIFVSTMGFALTISLLLSVMLYHFILRPIYQLSDAVKGLKQGEWQVKMSPRLHHGRDEIDVLVDSFVKMAGEIRTLVSGLNRQIDEKAAAERHANKFVRAVANSDSAVIIANNDLHIEYVNPKFLALTGSQELKVVGSNLATLLGDNMVAQEQSLRQHLSDGKTWRGEIEVNVSAGSLWLQQSIAPILSEQGECQHVVYAAQDISFIKQSQREMERMAYYDSLTGLSNRSYFKRQMQKALEQAVRGHLSFTLLYFDLDEFKRINDTLGHDVGDELLRRVASRIQGRLRKEDTFARLGGDEFAILLSGITEIEACVKVAQAVKACVTDPFMLSGNEVFVSASIGLAMAPRDGDNTDILLKRADLAMYQAKADGKNNYRFYDHSLDEVAREQMMLETMLRHGIKHDQLSLYYQPQVNSESGKVEGIEALLRWHHPEQGLIPPTKFIPIAERSGLIVSLGAWVLDQACKFAQQLEQEHGQDCKVSVNLSPRQLQDDDLLQRVAASLERYQLSSGRITLEITEGMLMDDIARSVGKLNQLRALGVQISIDDFGTGYSSLSYLKKLPLNTLKIDRSFVKDIPADQDDAEIVSAIIAMANQLNLQLIAEGVETQQQVDFLMSKQCYLIQGYFYAKPMAPEPLIEFLLARTEVDASVIEQGA